LGEDHEIQQTITRYLLGELPAEERERIEDQYFNSDEFFQDMVIAEDELIESYLYGELSGHTLERFKEHYLTSPPKRNKVEIARVLLNYSDNLPQPKSSLSTLTSKLRGSRIGSLFQRSVMLPRWLVFSAMLFIGLAIIQVIRLQWQMSRISTDRASLEQRQQELENESASQSARIDQLTAELEQARSQQQSSQQQATDIAQQGPSGPDTNSSSGIATGILIARLVRGTDNTQVLRVPPMATVLRLQINVEPGSYNSYRVTITDGDREVARQDNLKWRMTGKGYFITMGVPLTKLSPGRNYLLTVSGADGAGGIEDVGLSYFSIVRK
jgi:hypothetical protein